MSNKVKDIHIKNWTYYFFNDIMHIKNFDPNNTKLDEKSCKNIFIYYIGYLTIKEWKYVKAYNVNSLYLIFQNLNRYFDKINGNKYLTLDPTNKHREKDKKLKNFGVKSEI